MQKKWKKILSAAAVTAAAAAVLWLGGRMLSEEYVFWNGALLPRHRQELCISGKRMRNPEAFLKFPDLRVLDARDTGMTARQYEWFLQELPECRVIWEVPIQGACYSRDIQSLQVTELTEEEAASLQYLPELQLLDVGDWDDYPQIRKLQQRYPDCTVRYRVNIGGEWWDSDVVSLLLSDADPKELEDKLLWFENLESVLLTGTIPDQAELTRLQEAFPEVFFLWKMEALGMTLETDVEDLDLSGIALGSAGELEALLPYFPRLKTVSLNSWELPQEELVALSRRHPDISFLFELIFEDRILYTGAEELDLSNIPMADTKGLEEILPCFHNLEKVVMCQCGLSNETMDDLDKRYEDIRFVWSVDLGGMQFRTDAVHFTPNRWGLSVDDEDMENLCYCRDMICVDIGHAVKVTNCEFVRHMPQLKYLILAETGISDLTPLENHENLIYLELFLSKVKDYSPLTTCKALEDLNLCYTQGDPTPIGEMTWLKRLWWSGCWLARKELADKLPDTYTEYLSLSSTGRGWREGQNYYDMRDFIGMDYMTG